MKKNVKGIIVALFLLLGLRLYAFSESHFPLNPYIDTIFAENFTWDKFNQIEVGMSEGDVAGLLGQPLSKNPNYECWQYTTDGKLWPYADFSYYLVQVCFKNGTVESKPIYEFNN